MTPVASLAIVSMIFMTCVEVAKPQGQHTPKRVDGCPLFFERHGDSCYHAFDTPLLTWWDAMAFCALYAEGKGTLAVIEDNAEQTYIEGVLRSKFPTHTARDYWLGANDLVQEGTWVWIKRDETVEYTKWGAGEPNNGRAENCLALYDDLDYLWNDAPCELQEAFICEVPWHSMQQSIVG